MTARTFTRLALMYMLPGFTMFLPEIAAVVSAQQSTPIPPYACYEDRKPFCPVWGWVRGPEPIGQIIMLRPLKNGWTQYQIEVAPGFKCEQAEVSDKMDAFTVKCAKEKK